MLGIASALSDLRAAGCSRLWLDGSFVTAKDLPGDWDGCWAPDGVDPTRLDPALLNRAQGQSKYLGDVFLAGIEGASGLPFVDFFQRDRDGSAKGIVLLNPQEFP